MILVIDNYDSFVHNLARYFEQLDQEVLVVRNTAIDVAEVRRLAPAALVFSPGPCRPADSGCCLELVRTYHRKLPILGVCLGHQIIAQALGARVVESGSPVHGRSSLIWHDGQGLFAGIANPLVGGRYHSLVVDAASLPACLAVSARTATGTVMAIRHRRLPVVGLQFHPESILTEHGYRILAGFLRLAGLPVPQRIPTTRGEFAAR